MQSIQADGRDRPIGRHDDWRRDPDYARKALGELDEPNILSTQPRAAGRRSSFPSPQVSRRATA